MRELNEIELNEVNSGCCTNDSSGNCTCSSRYDDCTTDISTNNTGLIQNGGGFIYWHGTLQQ